MEIVSVNTQQPKRGIYLELLPQIHALTVGERDAIANISNIVALLHHTFGFHWTGIYFVKDNQLVLGPFQGPVACTRIDFGKGVCGTSWAQAKTIVVPDVHQYPGHIACSALSNSEIVVPVLKNQSVVAVLDIDSTDFSGFDDIDANYLGQIADHIATLL